jgi:dTDP-4-dehydrorhamnose reductase
MMKILITGAQGLLGRIMMKELSVLGEVAGTYHTRPAEGLLQLDIDNRDAVNRLVSGSDFTHIVNCAAIRAPEQCLENPEEAYRINSLAVEFLAAAANRAGAKLVQISTDYVFSGENPPYREDSLPCPVNVYGRTKLAGEYAARSAKKHLILRIPALWRADTTDTRNVACQFAGWMKAGETKDMDCETVRYYTLAEDIAAATGYLIRKGIDGIVHLSAGQKTSKADFARRLCVALGMSPGQVQDAPPPSGGDPRPLDSHLDTFYYESLGGPAFTGIDKALENIGG